MMLLCNVHFDITFLFEEINDFFYYYNSCWKFVARLLATPVYDYNKINISI